MTIRSVTSDDARSAAPFSRYGRAGTDEHNAAFLSSVDRRVSRAARRGDGGRRP